MVILNPILPHLNTDNDEEEEEEQKVEENPTQPRDAGRFK